MNKQITTMQKTTSPIIEFNGIEFDVITGEDDQERISFVDLCISLRLDDKTMVEILENQDYVDIFGLIFEKNGIRHLIKMHRVSFLIDILHKAALANAQRSAPFSFKAKLMRVCELAGQPSDCVVDDLYMLDKIEDPTLKNAFAKQLNEDYDIDLPVTFH